MRGDKRRMAKVKLKEATKELNQKASEILEDSARIRRSAEMLLQQLQRQKQQRQREEDERQKRQQAELHTKAWTMPDDDEGEPEPAPVPTEPEQAPKKESAPVQPVEKVVVQEAAPAAEKPEKKPVTAVTKDKISAISFSIYISFPFDLNSI